jgi:hypothetical protein
MPKRVLPLLLEFDPKDELSEKITQAAVQFLGNFVTGNENNAKFLWDICFPNIFHSIIALAENNKGILACIYMVIYNCICNVTENR